MSMIKVEDLTFSYPSSYDLIFDRVSFQIDTDWKLGFVGRNGRGKTTFLNLLLGKYEYRGKITSNVRFDYFPYRSLIRKGRPQIFYRKYVRMQKSGKYGESFRISMWRWRRCGELLRHFQMESRQKFYWRRCF